MDYLATMGFYFYSKEIGKLYFVFHLSCFVLSIFFHGIHLFKKHPSKKEEINAIFFTIFMMIACMLGIVTFELPLG